ncbi:MAG TPA: AbrB/MazE/SpoVT family DNA-binding domain-containing protein [Fimbriimonas sp.]|nr:AbrB/MazE/SpoVT family DNA-binding domain-containing protein [Fimbriimonas sp.]
MKNGKEEKCTGFSEAFYGSATVGERGQIVIPADARAEIGFEPGDKVLIMRHPIHKGVMLFKMEAVREFLDEFAEHVRRLEGSKEEVE